MVTVYKSGGKKGGAGSSSPPQPQPLGPLGPGGEKSTVDMEREQFLGGLQRSVAEAHASGDFGHALELATHAREEMEAYFGKDHPVVASAWNNVALMHKRLGRFDDAVDGYLMAVNTYRSAAGEKHPQYAAALTNLGLCFQAAALHRKGSLERGPLLERAVETLAEAARVKAESEVHYSDTGGSHATGAAQASMHLALASWYAAGGDNGVAVAGPAKPWTAGEGGEGGGGEGGGSEGAGAAALAALRRKTKLELADEALAAVGRVVEALRDQFGVNASADLATALNNAGFLLKCSGRAREALAPYTEAVAQRAALGGGGGGRGGGGGGVGHPDWVVAKHNLAECLRSLGDEAAAAAHQREILDAVGMDPATDDDGGGGFGDDDGSGGETRGGGGKGAHFGSKDFPMNQ